MNPAQNAYTTTARTEHQIDQLPFTGLDAGFIAAAGVLLIVLGLAAQRLTRGVKRPDA